MVATGRNPSRPSTAQGNAGTWSNVGLRPAKREQKVPGACLNQLRPIRAHEIRREHVDTRQAAFPSLDSKPVFRSLCPVF